MSALVCAVTKSALSEYLARAGERCPKPNFQVVFVVSSVGKGEALLNHRFKSGDLVIYTLSKRSPHPGPRARSVQPAELGDDYAYVVDKFWMVTGVEGNDQVIIVTRKGKKRVVLASDPLLKKANWWQRFRYRNRFPSPEILQTRQSSQESNLPD